MWDEVAQPSPLDLHFEALITISNPNYEIAIV